MGVDGKMGFASQTHFQEHIPSIMQKHAVLLHLKKSLSNFLFTWMVSEQRKLEKRINIQNYWVFGLCSSSGILKKKTPENITFWKLDLFAPSGEDGNRSSFQNAVFSSGFFFLEYQRMNKVQKPSNSKCYTPLSEPFRIYMNKHVNSATVQTLCPSNLYLCIFKS
jgi:hypothetical protein